MTGIDLGRDDLSRLFLLRVNQTEFDHRFDRLFSDGAGGCSAAAGVFKDHSEGVAGTFGGGIAREPSVILFAADFRGSGFAGDPH